MIKLRFDVLIFTILALIASIQMTRPLIAQPDYTDAYYYYNAAVRLVRGDGLTDPYLWNYLAPVDSLPAPSHLYWMPLTSLTAAFGMWSVNAPGDYHAAQWPFTALLFATVMIGFWLGGVIGKTRRHQWIAGLLTLFNGFYVRYWGMTDAFAPFAAIGSLALILIGLGAVELTQPPRRRRYLLWFAAGILSGLGHLTRADGVLLALTGGAVLFWPFRYPAVRAGFLTRTLCAGALLTGYLAVMTPWFARNIDAVGAPLPVGGAQAIWYTSYDDLFNYPPGASAERFFADGLATLFETRWIAFSNNLRTFLFVEGLIVLAPLLLLGLWMRRRDPFLQGLWIYALGLHVAFTLVFPFPGYRGGLLHSAVALLPWWAALMSVGLDDAVNWIARRRRRWNPRAAQTVFSIGMIALAAWLTWRIYRVNFVGEYTPRLHRQVMTLLPEDARVMVNDPAQFYFFTGRGGVVIPNAPVESVIDLAARYGITHLLVEGGRPQIPIPFRFDVENPPPFLTRVEYPLDGARLYAITPENNP